MEFVEGFVVVILTKLGVDGIVLGQYAGYDKTKGRYSKHNSCGS